MAQILKVSFDGDNRELDRLIDVASSVSKDLREIGLSPESIRPIAQPGAKGDLPTIAAFVVPILTSSGVLAAIVQIIKARLENPVVRSVRLELENKSIDLTNVTSKQQAAAFEAWMNAVQSDADD